MKKNIENAYKVSILTLFPEIFPGPLGVSLIGKALSNKIWDLNLINIRDFANDKHKSVDDTPYGGGAGMVMRPDIIELALNSISHFPGPRICLTPRGENLTQAFSENSRKSMRNGREGRYEGG